MNIRSGTGGVTIAVLYSGATARSRDRAPHPQSRFRSMLSIWTSSCRRARHPRVERTPSGIDLGKVKLAEMSVGDGECVVGRVTRFSNHRIPDLIRMAGGWEWQ
jgi:hypothetical protein